MILTGLFIFFMSINIPKQHVFDISGGSFLPSIVSFIMFISGVITVVSEYKIHQQRGNSVEEKQVPKSQNNNNYLIVVTFIIIYLIYIFLLQFLSFFIVSFLFLFISMFILKEVTWKWNIIISISTVIIIYFIFSSIFKIVFP